MPRYIDADAFEQKLADKGIFFPALFKNELNNTPTADVVPKSELEYVFEELEDVYCFFDDYDEVSVGNLREEINRLKAEHGVMI